MKANKTATTNNIMAIVTEASAIKSCKKVQMDNIIFPKWSDLGLLGMIFSQKIKTKEQPTGCDYPETAYQVVMRVIGGKVLMTGDRPDTYAWKQDKIEKLISNPENIRLIGTNSASAVINLANVLSTISNKNEKMLFADMFCSLNKDLFLITTPEENRKCIKITEDLYNKGITFCVDSWMSTDADGKSDVTLLNIGDYLIIEDEGVYCIRHDEFIETHVVM